MPNVLHCVIRVLALFSVASLGAEPIRVGVSVLPLQSVVAEIGGPEIEVRSLQQPGDSCSAFEPRPSSITWLAQADLFFRTGLGFETVIMDKLANQFEEMHMVDLRDAVSPIQATHSGHSHGHACAVCASCSGDALDPHIWMDPRRLAQISSSVSRQLSEIIPESASAFTAREADFTERAHALDARIESMLSPYKGRAFFIYHPALGYFADRYGLVQVPISSSGQAPTARELHDRIRQARESGVRVIFVQPQESKDNAEVVARAVGASLFEINPLAENWEENLLEIAGALVAGFEQE